MKAVTIGIALSIVAIGVTSFFVSVITFLWKYDYTKARKRLEEKIEQLSYENVQKDLEIKKLKEDKNV